MKKIEVKVRYLFEGTYTVVADDRNEARTMVTRDCGLVLGGNIHTTLDDDEVDWEFDVHPDMQIISYTELEKKQKQKRLKMDFSDRIETLRKDIIDAIRQLLYSHGLTEITFPEEQDDPVWVIWFDNNADPFECKVTDNSMTVIAHEKEANFEATCHTPFELGAAERFYAELSDNNREMLVNRAVALYDGKAIRQEKENSEILVCVECGSPQVEVKACVNANTDEFISDIDVDYCGRWCDQCDDNADLCTKEEYIDKMQDWWDCKGKKPEVFKHPEGAAHKAIRQALGGAYFSFHNSQRLQGKMVLGEDSYGHSGDKYFWPLSYSSAKTAQKRMDNLENAGIRCKLTGYNGGCIEFLGYTPETEALLEKECQEVIIAH